MKMASSVRDFLIELDPENREEYDKNFKILARKIGEVDSAGKRTFFIIRQKEHL